MAKSRGKQISAQKNFQAVSAGLAFGIDSREAQRRGRVVRQFPKSGRLYGAFGRPEQTYFPRKLNPSEASATQIWKGLTKKTLETQDMAKQFRMLAEEKNVDLVKLAASMDADVHSFVPNFVTFMRQNFKKEFAIARKLSI